MKNKQLLKVHVYVDQSAASLANDTSFQAATRWSDCSDLLDVSVRIYPQSQNTNADVNIIIKASEKS